jgi:hypothetical protein
MRVGHRSPILVPLLTMTAIRELNLHAGSIGSKRKAENSGEFIDDPRDRIARKQRHSHPGLTRKISRELPLNLAETVLASPFNELGLDYFREDFHARIVARGFPKREIGRRK